MANIYSKQEGEQISNIKYSSIHDNNPLNKVVAVLLLIIIT